MCRGLGILIGHLCKLHNLTLTAIPMEHDYYGTELAHISNTTIPPFLLKYLPTATSVGVSIDEYGHAIIV